MNEECYLNGRYLPLKDAFVHAYDIGMTRGYGIYEGIMVYGEKPFRLEEHLERFEAGAKILNLKIPHTPKEIENVILELVRRNGFGDTKIRIILTGGDTVNSVEYDPKKPTFFVMAEEYISLPEDFYNKGGEVMTYEHQRFMPGCKTINYITAVNLQSKRKEKKAIEILYVSNGRVLEASTSNFFIFKGDTLITPKENILFGITRKVVLELAKGKFKVEEREVKAEELQEADEAFITASYKEIVPIVRINGALVGDGKVGRRTVSLMESFKKITRG
ncbi:MAG: hypothetical protein A2836_02005 [Candidatus Taylorbacteria bacterium RIFCSPHIGHO2_01_FULL_45_63]|uniref:Branched-chain amino acid aminotransferase n=1 Tax=Candidatus Taylorbacteria bacterium RIFCSPHIGHO2_02_FULL_45_35 TaxID=1802311 RepID=A0A1G2MWJ6_9BACT|nr:MAG: hypothetical protein A2836_02005 [Candidatus Taylorbacteria bacterium RIFCSPHIGHO2_01_FULL_45_63]OHA27452.1 MAG: hypothetical protein A3D56_00650 [Candidatus Taylorbacteria bacterium RIFCSPHIGHO2_02_FULL_45_35]OHA34491.1 MAG: hypothetical protein A3A22_02655 [Candidatus Taylorbacteria bacterium RIFCSPLOWO2_01_FULL_45_34b]